MISNATKLSPQRCRCLKLDALLLISLQISARALSKSCDVCVATLNIFLEILGSECLGAALRVLATGGVYIAGGIPPKILPLITETPVLIKAFENCSPPMRDVVTRFPLKVVSDPNVGLLGAKILAKQQISVIL